MVFFYIYVNYLHTQGGGQQGGPPPPGGGGGGWALRNASEINKKSTVKNNFDCKFMKPIIVL